MKSIPVDLKILSDVVVNEVVKNTKFITLKTKVNILDKKFPDLTPLIYINQYNTDKQNSEKKIEKIRCKWLVVTTVLITKVSEIEKKYLILVI